LFYFTNDTALAKKTGLTQRATITDVRLATHPRPFLCLLSSSYNKIMYTFLFKLEVSVTNIHALINAKDSPVYNFEEDGFYKQRKFIFPPCAHKSNITT